MTDQPSPKPEKLSKSGDDFAGQPLKDKIGNNLQQLYNDVVSEDIPADFLALLATADTKKN